MLLPGLLKLTAKYTEFARWLGYGSSKGSERVREASQLRNSTAIGSFLMSQSKEKLVSNARRSKDFKRSASLIKLRREVVQEPKQDVLEVFPITAGYAK